MLTRFKITRKLGKGAYGDVFLVEDKDGNRFALKQISVKMINQEAHLRDYLNGEIECMEAMNSQYIIKLMEKEEDQQNINLLLEYCDGGDLINYQSKLPNKVFTLDEAVMVLSQVIRGLQQLHEKGYLHRDIKSQNVLVKNQNGKKVFKLADFGFSKKDVEASGTVLGTENFMSPEIYHGENYGFEVDMWAFGVLFFFMLNTEFPFKINPHYEIEKKELQLKKIAANFSYQRFVEKSKKKLLKNCTPELEDLFRRMFDIDQEKRISFADIREHAVFREQFPEIAPKSRILYAQPFQSKIVKKSEEKLKKREFDIDTDIKHSMCIIRNKVAKFPLETVLLERKKDEIDFLRDNTEEFLETDTLQLTDKLMLAYNLLKYYIVLLRNFRQFMCSQALKDKHPQLNWDDFWKTKEFKEICKETEEDLVKYETKFDSLYDQCEGIIARIEAVNPKFIAAYHREITESGFQGPFRESYRKSTAHIFALIREGLKSNKKGNKLNYIMSLLVISHAFNNIFSDLQNLKMIFHPYLEQCNKTVQTINYSELREWMTKSSKETLNGIAKSIIKIYFQ